MTNGKLYKSWLPLGMEIFHSFFIFSLLMASMTSHSHDGRHDEAPCGPDQTDGEHGEADVLGLVEVTRQVTEVKQWTILCQKCKPLVGKY